MECLTLVKVLQVKWNEMICRLQKGMGTEKKKKLIRSCYKWDHMGGERGQIIRWLWSCNGKLH